MNSIRMVRIEDRLRLMIKLIFLVLLKFVLLLIWGVSIWGIYTLLYDRYVYRVKAWFISLKEQSTVGMCIYSCIDFLIKLCLITYGTMVVLAGFILAGAILVLPLLMILRLILH